MPCILEKYIVLWNINHSSTKPLDFFVWNYDKDSNKRNIVILFYIIYLLFISISIVRWRINWKLGVKIIVEIMLESLLTEK